MRTIKLETEYGPVWVVAAQVVWFWDYDGLMIVGLTGKNKPVEARGITAAQFARALAAGDGAPC